MEWLVLGLFVGVLIGYKIKSSNKPLENKTANQKKDTVSNETLSVHEEPYSPIGTLNKPRDGHTTYELNIPIEVLPNLYSVSLSNISIKHELVYDNGIKKFDYVTLKCRVNYRLNGRKEGKRRIIFTSYDQNDGVLDSWGEHKVFRFTDAGCEIVEVCFNDCDIKYPSKFSVSIQELPDGRYV